MAIKKKYSISIVPLTIKGQGLHFRISNLTVIFLVFCLVSILLFATISLFAIIKITSQKPDANLGKITQLQQEYDKLKSQYDTYRKITEEQTTLFQTSLNDIYRILGVEKNYISNNNFNGRGGPLSSLEDSKSSTNTDLFESIVSSELEKLMSVSFQASRICEVFTQNEFLATKLPTKLPVEDNDNYTITDRFGWRMHPIFRRKDFHSGLDIASNYKTELVAPADGFVSWIGYKGALGKTIELNHQDSVLVKENGDLSTRVIKTRYSHLTKTLVKIGQTVRRGDVIGLMGSTGLSTAPHLHYEVLIDGRCVDPMDFILDVK